MKLVRRTAVLAVVTLAFVQSQAFAQDSHPRAQQSNQAYVQHSDWTKGARINSADWNRGQKIDFRTHHLDAPPAGSEWRLVDGNYVLAGYSTGLIAAAVVARHAH